MSAQNADRRLADADVEKKEIDIEELDDVAGGVGPGVFIDLLSRRLDTWVDARGEFLYCKYCNHKTSRNMLGVAEMRSHLRDAHQIDIEKDTEVQTC